MAEIQKQFETLNDGLLVRAPGKINLSLLVKGKRADGYHELESIMAKIGWYDEIVIEKVALNGCGCDARFVKRPTSNVTDTSRATDGRNTQPSIELICKGEYKVPEGGGNLVYKAAKLILEARTEDGGQKTEDGRQRTENIKLTLVKNMPAGSGLGSGSSDAAATLMGINKYLKLGFGKSELREMAAKLGSDVAFFLDGPTAFCMGRGEKVKKLFPCEFGVFLVIPDVSVSTKRVYENYRHDEDRYKRFHKHIREYIVKKRIDLICGMCANMLKESCFELHPDLEKLKNRMESFGIRPISLSGSGSSMFCVIGKDNEEEIRRNKGRLEREYGCKGIIININSW